MMPLSKNWLSFARSIFTPDLRIKTFSSLRAVSESSKIIQFKRFPSFYEETKFSHQSCSVNVQTKLELNPLIGDYERRKEIPRTSRNRTGVFFFFLAGVFLGASVKQAFNFWRFLKDSSIRLTDEKNESILLPKVLAAKGFSQTADVVDTPINRESTSQKDSSSDSSIPKFNGRGANKGPPKHRDHFNFIADVVERLSPSVAFIEVIDLRRLDAYGNPLAVNNGSGVVVDSSGLIITNAHVVTGSSKPRSSKIIVRLVDGRELDCVLEDIDLNCDLALLRVNATDLTPAPLGSSSELRPGEFVVAVGAPLALSNTVTAGVVSSTARCAKDLGIRANDINYIQTDAAITFGNSGGPLANLDGDVIGINSMKAAAGISFAIPVDVAKDFLARAHERMKLKRSSSSESVSKRRRFLGITMLSLTPDIISELQARVAAPLPHSLSHGVLVWRVVIGSPAYHAGLQPGDVITQINGHDITSARDVYTLLERPTDLTMIVHRGNQRYTVTVQPEE